MPKSPLCVIGRLTVIALLFTAGLGGCGGNPEQAGPPELPDAGVPTGPDAPSSIHRADASINEASSQPRTDGCTIVACRSDAGMYCGVIGNGCNGQQDCGSCPAGMVCGANGMPNVCGYEGDACTAIQCTQPGGTYCGNIG